MAITLASCNERSARADIDPMLTGFYEELSPKLVSKGSSAVDIPFWVEYFWHHADQYLPPDGRIWIVRDDTGQAVGWGTLRRIRPDAGEMNRLCGRAEARGQGTARRWCRLKSTTPARWGGYICSPTPSVTMSRGRRSISPWDSASSTRIPKAASPLHRTPMPGP